MTYFSVPDALEASYERLSRSKWEHIDDFLPLLAIDESKIRSIQMQINHVIKARIYLLKKYFSVSYCIEIMAVYKMCTFLIMMALAMAIELIRHDVPCVRSTYAF